MKFNPDLVILAFFEGNDFDDNRQGSIFQLKEGELIKTIPTEESSPKMRYYRKQIMIQNFPGYRFMVGHSHLANFLRKKYADYLVRRVVSAQKKDDEKSHAAQGPKVVSEADWNLTKQILLRWREDCRKINSTPLILFIPDSKNVRSYAKLKTVSNRTDKIMGDFAYANNILFIDLTDQFLRYPDVKSLYLQDGHLSPLGHDIVGGEIARFLRARTII